MMCKLMQQFDLWVPKGVLGRTDSNILFLFKTEHSV